MAKSNPNACKRKPYPTWTYVARGMWMVIQITVWRLAWRRISSLRPAILKLFGATLPWSCQISGSVRIHFPWALCIGRHVAISHGVVFYNLGGVSIGSRVVVSQDAYFFGGTHDYTDATYPLIPMPIVIEDDVWIGAGAFIGPGVKIGAGAVVGARAVITKDVLPWKVVAGNPALIIKDRVLNHASE